MEVIEAYAAAWHEHDVDARRALLESAWADDGVYCDPLATVEGREALIAHIGGFHAQQPGTRIETTSRVDEHDGHVRFAFRVIDAQGAVVFEGMDYGRLGSDGRLERIVGFFGAL
jgi:hypothetical protein